ncbi:conserved hypothetical protein [Desulfatibacillum aliphaticivorans]|uniref:Uncharacterized protein n=1 Tax=Desulfatibacillum aliphaticivorans TaxID=218208 RepID=B8FHK3_DESAL|nr:conserved hypothetical protein [Desulfatibacillum aliphaticivorans]
MTLESNEIEPRSQSRSVRKRAVILGSVLALLICAVTPYNNVYLQGTPLGGGHFPLAPFCAFLILTLVAYALAKLIGREILTGMELLVSWILMALVSGIAYTGLVRTFFINMTAPYHFATAGNRWAETLHPLLPKSWYPQNPDAVQLLYNGLDGGRDMGWMELIKNIPWSAWTTPLITWSVFILLSYFVMLCMVNIFARQWVDNERMNLPLLQVPLAMEEAVQNKNLGGFFGNPYLLAGLCIPVFLHILNGLHFYYPSVPDIPTLILAGPYFPKYGLFSAFHKLKIHLFPAYIGFAFLASRQISFSFWFFFILGGLFIGALSLFGLNIPAAALGVTFGPNITRPEETQMLGAYGIFFLFILWLARRHLADVVREAFGRKPVEWSGAQWFSTRHAFWGFVIGYAALILWNWYFGMPLIVSFLVIGAFFMIMLVASRIICQGGVAYFSLTMAPLDGMMSFFGPQFFSKMGVLIAGVSQKVLFLDLRESLMPSLFHASKISKRAGRPNMFLLGMTVTIILAVAVSFISMLALCYKFGIRELQLDWATRTTLAALQNVQTLVESPPDPGHWVHFFSILGAVVMLILVVCYHRFYWWPIHPIGYLTAYSSAMKVLWFSFFVGWLANSLCMRYGGVKLFNRLRLFFMGLIIGDFVMGGIWAIVGLFGDSSYMVLYN